MKSETPEFDRRRRQKTGAKEPRSQGAKEPRSQGAKEPGDGLRHMVIDRGNHALVVVD
jgi:hypothetical protein